MNTNESTSLGAPTKPLSSLKGYKPEWLLNDIVAGIVIAALSIPVAMGYADIAGLPPEYGLYASVIAPLVFALITGTKSIVFGMDSAASAMTGSMLATIGVALGSTLCIQVMPVLTLFVAAFLLLFALFKAGRIIRLIPTPVMHGFIAGISVTVITTQIPLLLGTTADTSGPFWEDIINVACGIPSANIPSACIAVISLICIVGIKKLAPKVPSALVALAIAAIVTTTLNLNAKGVVTLNPVEAGLPLPVLPDFTTYDLLSVAFAALAIAIVVALESLLCLETFSIKAGTRSNGNRELYSLGLTNVVCSLFACPPCSASISRTAAGESSGGKSQVASIVAALVVAAVVLFCGPVLQFMPRAALSAIVTVALIEVCDFRKIARYAKHMKSEFAVFLVAFALVILFGAVPGIVGGFAIACIIAFVRTKRTASEEPMGVVPYGRYKMPQKKRNTDPGVKYEVFKLEGNLSFLNIDATIDKLVDAISPDTGAVIIKLSAVTSLDTTATDKLLQLLDMLYARRVHVKLVRKVRPTNDSYTRFELSTLMRLMKFYPNVRSALVSLKNDVESGVGPLHASAWLEQPEVASPNEGEEPLAKIVDSPIPLILDGDHPVLTVRAWEDATTKKGTKRILHGKLSYLQSQAVVLFDAGFNPNLKISKDETDKTICFDTLLVFVEDSGEPLLEYDRGDWEYLAVNEEHLNGAIAFINEYVAKTIRNQGKDVF